jgi:hypothetical protein
VRSRGPWRGPAKLGPDHRAARLRRDTSRPRLRWETGTAGRRAGPSLGAGGSTARRASSMAAGAAGGRSDLRRPSPSAACTAADGLASPIPVVPAAALPAARPVLPRLGP